MKQVASREIHLLKVLIALLATCFMLVSFLAYSSTCFLLGLFSDPDDGGDTFLGKVGCLSTVCKALYPRR
jgi:hypothetical protein